MATADISYKNKALTLHKSITTPHFNERTVLVTSTWDYVDLWLKRNKKSEARFFWNQARSFYEATLSLPKTSAPLTAYYCFLNATKALLLTKGNPFGDQHGVSGFTAPGPTALSNERIKIKNGGVLPALCQAFGEQINPLEIYTLKDVLYNLPYIHRAFNLTFTDTELFIPINNQKVVRSTQTHEAWLVAELLGKYANATTINKLPLSFERDAGHPEKHIIRSVHRFEWRPREKAESLARFKNYHARMRKEIVYIHAGRDRWYLRRGGAVAGAINRNCLVLTFAAMHRLSELSRYAPDRLAKHFDCQHNWLLSEFIVSAPNQFIDAVSSEITGHEFFAPERL
jgi:hypothetical protein